MSGKPKGLSCKEDALDPQQATQLLLVCSSLRHKFIIYSLMFAGLRVSELKHPFEELQKLAVDPDEIRVPGKLYDDLVEQAEDTVENPEEDLASIPSMLGLASGLSLEVVAIDSC